MLSIVVTWRDRAELRQVLPGLLQVSELTNGDVTVVNFGGSETMIADQVRGVVGPCRVIGITNQTYFNKAAAQNIGAAATRHPALFFCDCDILVNPREVYELASQVSKTTGVFGTLAGVQETVANARQAGHVVKFGYELRIETSDGRHLRIVDSEEDARDGTRQAPGLLVVRRDDFLAINGYNGRLPAGWGWEDQDMVSRLTLGAGLARITQGVAKHISHDDHARTAFYPPARDQWESRDRMFRQALANYDRGDFHGSYDRDRREIEWRIVPIA